MQNFKIFLHSLSKSEYDDNDNDSRLSFSNSSSPSMPVSIYSIPLYLLRNACTWLTQFPMKPRDQYSCDVRIYHKFLPPNFQYS